MILPRDATQNAVMPRQVVCLSVWKQVFAQTSMAELREKSKLLTTYMEYLLLTRHGQPTDQNPSSATSKNRPYLKIITPADPEQRGSQLSIWFSVHVGLVFRELSLRGVVVIYVYGWLPYSTLKSLWQPVQIEHDLFFLPIFTARQHSLLCRALY